MNWFLQDGNETDVIMSSRIRLIRNISGISFTNKASIDELRKVHDKMEEITIGLGYGLKFFDIKDLSKLERDALAEKHIMTKKFANGEYPFSAVIMNDDESISILVNGEDHIKIEGIATGLELENLLNLLVEIDQKLEKMIPYSYNERYGYLTSSPASVGTALKASVFVHLPALSSTGNIRNFVSVVNNLGMNVRGVYGEGSKVEGDIYKISNNQTLGVTEKEVIKNLNVICKKVISQEREARKYLGKQQVDLEDKIYRDYGILTNARKIDSYESLNLLSNIKMGVDLGILKEISDKKIRELYLYTKPANMAIRNGLDKKMSNDEEQEKRAETIKQILADDNE